MTSFLIKAAVLLAGCSVLQTVQASPFKWYEELRMCPTNEVEVIVTKVIFFHPIKINSYIPETTCVEQNGYVFEVTKAPTNIRFTTTRTSMHFRTSTRYHSVLHGSGMNLTG